MYVYIQSEPNLWTVGFYGPSGCWNPESDHGTPEEAAVLKQYSLSVSGNSFVLGF